MDEYQLRGPFNFAGLYPSSDELAELTGVNEFTGPVRRIKVALPLKPEFHDWLDEVTPAARKRALRLELDADAHDASAMCTIRHQGGGPCPAQ